MQYWYTWLLHYVLLSAFRDNIIRYIDILCCLGLTNDRKIRSKFDAHNNTFYSIAAFNIRVNWQPIIKYLNVRILL